MAPDPLPQVTLGPSGTTFLIQLLVAKVVVGTPRTSRISGRFLGRLNELKHKTVPPKKPTEADPPDEPDEPDLVFKPGRPNHTNRACFPDDVSIHKANSLKLLLFFSI